MRRDEATAQTREEEQDRRTQIIDSERRLQLLRGNQTDNLPAHDESPVARSRTGDHGHNRKRRRLAGEDDTDRDLRLARENAAPQPKRSDSLQATSAPLTDSQGHIDLFPSRLRNQEKNIEAEAESAKKKQEYEDQFTMRFSNAAGFKQGLNAPWYVSGCKHEAELPGKDVRGNDDINKREREKIRADSNDPLAVIKQGVRQLRDVEKSRKNWMAEREEEMRELETWEHASRSKKTHRKRCRERNDSDTLENFSLDNSREHDKKEKRHHKPRSRGHCSSESKWKTTRRI